jgi:hypothetical protein
MLVTKKAIILFLIILVGVVKGSLRVIDSKHTINSTSDYTL